LAIIEVVYIAAFAVEVSDALTTIVVVVIPLVDLGIGWATDNIA
jgi:hypothetical protein